LYHSPIAYSRSSAGWETDPSPIRLRALFGVVSIEKSTQSSVDILPALKREDSHGTAPLGWDIVVYDVTRS